MSVITRGVKRTLGTSWLAAGMLAVSALPATALHFNTIGPIDVIDGAFGPGGGTIAETLTLPPCIDEACSGTGETDWFAFGATTGDIIQIHTEGTTDTVLGVFFDLSGLVEVGDDPKCANTILFDCKLVGQDPGFHLEFLAFDFDSGPGANAQVNFVAGATGAYAFAVQEYSKNNSGDYTVTLAFAPPPPGSGASISIPEPGALAIFGFGLAALGFARRRKAARHSIPET